MKKQTRDISESSELRTPAVSTVPLWINCLVSDKHWKQRNKSSVVCRGRNFERVKDSAKNSSFLQKENNPKLRAESKPYTDRDVSFILMFKQILFWFDT